MTLRVVEIFESIQGESTRAGLPCVFVRLAGCDIDCTYCDTPGAHDAQAGSDMTVDEVVSAADRYETALVEITGGEPLLQREGVKELAHRLLAMGKTVMLETNGCHSLSDLDRRVEVVMDVKTPGSGAADRLCRENLSLLDGNDEVKFVLTGREDYQWACRFLAANDLSRLRAVHFSPAWRLLSPAELAAWIRRGNPPARLAVQLHRLLGVA